MGMPIITADLNLDPGSFLNVFKGKGEIHLYLFKRNGFPQGKIKIFRKTIIGNVAFLDGRTAFEGKDIYEGCF